MNVGVKYALQFAIELGRHLSIPVSALFNTNLMLF